MDSIDVRTIPDGHPKIRVRDWIGPLVCRLLQSTDYLDGKKSMDFDVRHCSNETTEAKCEFYWKNMKEDFDTVRRTYQEPTITEFATLALACVGVEKFAGLAVTEVTRRGQGPDYWIGDELLLEVSGQQEGNLEKLHEDKLAQLKRNPWSKDGYVCVANYRKNTVRFWYHSHES